jgi:hypothetical protein
MAINMEKKKCLKTASIIMIISTTFSIIILVVLGCREGKNDL